MEPASQPLPVPRTLRTSLQSNSQLVPSAGNLLGLTKFGKVKDFLAGPVPSLQRGQTGFDPSDRPRNLVAEYRGALEEEETAKDATRRKRLLEERCDTDGRTLLHEAVLTKDAGLVDSVLVEMEQCKAGDPNATDLNGCTPLHWLCWFSDDLDAPEPLQVLNVLLGDKRIQVDARDHRGNTPLMLAADQCNENFVERLMEAGADVDARSKTGASPLLAAVYRGSARVAERLTAAGADVDVEGEHGLTPLMLAVKRDDVNLAVLLVKAGAKVELATSAGTACSLSQSDVVRKFLIDSAFYQNHSQKKKQQAYNKMVVASRANFTRSITPTTPIVRRSPVSSPVLGAAAGPTSLQSSAEESATGPLVDPATGLRIFTSLNNPLDLDYFSHPILGSAQLGMCMCPGRNKPKKTHIWRRDLQTDLHVIQESGCQVVVTLVRSKELLSMGIMELFVRIRQLGMDSLHFPVPDKWIPESMGEVITLVTKLVEWVQQGRKVVIHW